MFFWVAPPGWNLLVHFARRHSSLRLIYVIYVEVENAKKIDFFFERGATGGTLRGNGAVTFFCGREAAAKKCMKHRIAERRMSGLARRKSCHAGT